MQQAEVGRVQRREWMLAGPSSTVEEIAARPTLSGLVEDLLLASLSRDGYLLPARHHVSAGLAASAIVELALRGRVAVDHGRLLVTDVAPTGDGIVDPVLEALSLRRRAPGVERCLEQLGLDWTILSRAAVRLESRGLVRIERRALHPLIMHRFHPLPPGRPAERRARLRCLLGATWEISPRDAALAALAGASGLLQIGRGGSSDPDAELDVAARALGATAAAAMLAAVHPALIACTRRRPEWQSR